ncbi:uncharacterized protein ISCGN_033209 [Ixodes scapularis]
MTVHCCVPQCKQRGISDSDGNKVSFHRFPRDPTLYKKWIIAMKRDEGANFRVNMKSTKVCSKHFRTCDFIPGVASGHNLLRDTAVPSVFAFKPQSKVRKPPKQRAPPLVKKNDHPLQSVAPTAQASEVVHQDTVMGSSDGVDAAVASPVEPVHDCSSRAAEAEHLASVVDQQKREIARLRDECEQLRQQLENARGALRELHAEKIRLECQVSQEQRKSASFCIERFKDCDEDFMFYTGLPGYHHFTALLRFLDTGKDGCNVLRTESSSGENSLRGRKRKLTTENELFLVLVRLRLGLFEADLAHRFSIAQSTVSRICMSWLNFLYAKLSTFPLWAPRETTDAMMPGDFVKKYASTRVILDATEVQCEVPTSPSLQSSTYSMYKSANTFKGLVGVLPNGLLAFVSELYTGSTSDRETVIRSGFLELTFEENDSVMADKGFLIEDLLERKGVKLNLPPFLRGRTFTDGQVQETKEIASLRIHVERRIQRIKAYHIFDRPIPLTLAPVANQIWTVAAILTNFQSRLINRTGSADMMAG